MGPPRAESGFFKSGIHSWVSQDHRSPKRGYFRYLTIRPGGACPQFQLTASSAPGAADKCSADHRFRGPGATADDMTWARPPLLRRSMHLGEARCLRPFPAPILYKILFQPADLPRIPDRWPQPFGPPYSPAACSKRVPRFLHYWPASPRKREAPEAKGVGVQSCV